jgi:hypothetical protein
MARSSRVPENQHYVPQMLLRGFAYRRKKEWYVYAFDKQVERAFPTNIRNIAAERGFYEFMLKGQSFRYEQTLSSLEYNTSSAFSKLLDSGRVSTLSEEDRSWVSVFLAAQHVRTKNFRQSLLDMDRRLCELITSSGGNPHKVKGYRPFRNEDELKYFVLRFLMENLSNFASHMMSKQWVLMETTPSRPFWIGDNPVAMHNFQNFGPYGNIGLAIPGIEIYLPIHREKTLCLWCPTLLERMRRQLEEAQSSLRQLRAYTVIGAGLDTSVIHQQIREFDALVSKLGGDIQRIEEGRSISSSPENVIYLNTLQARWADRYVMSPTAEFSLIRRMLKDFPESRQGPRVSVG